MASKRISQALRRSRLAAGISQQEVAEKIGVSQATVSNWELGRGSPKANELQRLESLLGSMSHGVADEKSETETSPFGVWLNRTRINKGLTVHELAEKAEITPATIYNLEAGRSGNPQKKTREELATALGERLSRDTVRATEEAAAIKGMGNLRDFNPHDKNDLPQGAGVYVFYDISQRPIYVGQSANLRTRIQGHFDKFWFKSPIVEYGSYITIGDKQLREQVEEILIRFLKKNVVLNIQHVER